MGSQRGRHRHYEPHESANGRRLVSELVPRRHAHHVLEQSRRPLWRTVRHLQHRCADGLAPAPASPASGFRRHNSRTCDAIDDERQLRRSVVGTRAGRPREHSGSVSGFDRRLVPSKQYVGRKCRLCLHVRCGRCEHGEAWRRLGRQRDLYAWTVRSIDWRVLPEELELERTGRPDVFLWGRECGVHSNRWRLER